MLMSPRRRPPPSPPRHLHSRLLLLLLVLLLLLDQAASFFLPPPAPSSSSHTRSLSRRHFTPPQQQQQQQKQDDTTTTTPTTLALPSSSPQYQKLMDNLSDDEKYNILMQSRASSLVETLGGRGPSSSPSSPTTSSFEPLYKLMEEMTAKNVQLTPKSFAALVDAASLSRELGIIQQCLLLARKNGVCRTFSRDVGALGTPPTARDASKVQGLAPVPIDDRSLELGAGLAALALVGGALGVEAVGPLFHVDTGPASIFLFFTTVVSVLDFTQRQGKELKLVLAGLNRLFMRDPEREARIQAATFLVAYLLGLPCFCFSPNVLEAVRMATEVPDFREVLSSTAGLNRLLIYLLAPVAAEEANHVQLIVSDPRQARALVQLFKERNKDDVDVDPDIILPWAYQEARRLLSSNKALLEKVRQQMETGGVSVGDCVSTIEKFYDK